MCPFICFKPQKPQEIEKFTWCILFTNSQDIYKIIFAVVIRVR